MDYIFCQYDYRYKSPELLEHELTLSRHFFQGFERCRFSILFQSHLKGSSRIISPKGQKAFKILLPLADRLAREQNGMVQGILLWDRWEALVRLTLPSLRLEGDGLADLRELAVRSRSVTLFPLPGGQLRLDAAVELFAPRP